MLNRKRKDQLNKWKLVQEQQIDLDEAEVERKLLQRRIELEESEVERKVWVPWKTTYATAINGVPTFWIEWLRSQMIRDHQSGEHQSDFSRSSLASSNESG